MVIDVVYDGVDLAEVADRTGLTTAQVINAHTATPWLVGFAGFMPGFAYLVGGDPRLNVPAARSRGPRCPPARWAWPANSAGSTHAEHRADGS
ncbi:allophanate hydrolase subunit 1 [Mycobacterium xenopi 4042]|uniref:Allophanate hydrolase subunit 1 n=1 Tax=Mycobacterium xenopi 4042 TaxID=1299334 RepID=X7Z9F4_MYCXE|nr:allophanate hydrolase subunit 1 [Mycobacterium xenopi 4042]